MHHPGPPRFVVTGDEVELAPRDPDPTATYTWHIRSAPDESAATLGDDPVEQFVPDAPGTYVIGLTAPDGDHSQTIRAFPGELSGGRRGRSGFSGGYSGQSGSGFSGISGRSGSGFGSGSARVLGGTGGSGGRPRLTLEAIVREDEVVVRANPTPHPDSDETPGDFDIEFLLDDRDEIDADAVEEDDQELRVPIDAFGDRARVYATAVGAEGYSVPDAVEFTRVTDGGTTITTGRPYDPPAWAEDSTIYEIYVRGFNGAEEDTDFDDIIERLDYIESLGVDVLWLTPVLQNDHAPHGYNIVDFFSIASDLGSREDYERFVEAAHDRGLKVLFDLVCNHSARTHPFFENAVQGPDSEYRDWYEWRTETEPETYFEWEHIANFNFDHLPVRRHLLDAVEQWAPLVDGFRCDMAWAVPNGFWRELHDKCKDDDGEFLLLDETIPYIPDFQAGLFDMHFDSTTYFTLRQIGRGQDAGTVLDAIEERADAGFPDHASFMLYAENHDETRYVTECGRDAAKAAVSAVFTLPGAPMVYAGQEFGQRGRRDGLAWEHADESFIDHVRSLTALRREQPALSSEGELVRLDYESRDADADRVVAYGRMTGADAVVVVLNFGEEPATVEVPGHAGETDMVSGESVGTGDGAVTVDSVAVLPAEAAAFDN